MLKWSALPVIPWLPLCVKEVFMAPDLVDSILVGLVTGYVTGFFVYALTVMIPSSIRSSTVMKDVGPTLLAIYLSETRLFLTMCKCVCSKESWGRIAADTDAECFSESFYKAIREFDFKAPAYTIYRDKETGQEISWAKYSTMILESNKEELINLFLRYHSYLNDELVDLILKLKTSPLYSVFVGNSSSPIMEILLSERNGKEYCDTVPISMLIDGGNYNPLFASDENSKLLKDHISLLKDLHVQLCKYKKSYRDRQSIRTVSREKYGIFESAKIKTLR